MNYPALEKYLARLNDTVTEQSRVWLDAEGRAQGKYFNTTLTSAFQPVRAFGGSTQARARIVAQEGFARSYSQEDSGLHLWRLLDQAASDDESVELDRLCRMLHAINFYRQASETVGLHLSVHARLLTAVDSNHGIAFRRILNLLELPHDKIVLQMPVVTQNQGWLLNYVLDNYRRNGFKLGVSAIDARELNDLAATRELLSRAAVQGVQIVFKRVENAQVFDQLAALVEELALPLYAQGYLWDTPAALLRTNAADVKVA